MVLEGIHPPAGGPARVTTAGSTHHSTSESEKKDFTMSERSNSRTNSNSNSLTHVDTLDDTLKNKEALQPTYTTYEQNANGLLYSSEGVLILQPAPTKDPRDPLNLPFSRKFLAVFCLCIFGAFAAAAELILGAMLPVFALQYAGIEPGPFLLSLSEVGGIPAGSDPLKALSMFPNSPPIWEVYLLASLPVLMIGVSNMGLIPVSIAVGRRAVVLGCGVLAITGAVWAGFSQSLASHLGARCLQALGAGTVESLIPFIIQDIVHVHQRNTWISMLFATQGIIIIGLGIGTPYIIVFQNWRWVYYYTALVAAAFLVGVFFFLPETRWPRTRAEMNGVPRDETGHVTAPRTWAYDLALTHGNMEWRKGFNAFIDTLRTFFYPQIFFITMLNSAMIGCAFAAGYTASPALMTAPWSWPFLHLGLCLIPVLIAAVATGFVTGFCADWTANLVAKKRGKRVPENQLLNLILPTACALIGAVIFGVSGTNQDDYHWIVFLLGLGMMAFGFLGANTVGAVYVLECYPHLAGPALVNIASFRCIIAFILSFRVSEWIADMGYFNSMMIYVGITGAFALLIPVVYFYGPAWRRRFPADSFGDK